MNGRADRLFLAFLHSLFQAHVKISLKIMSSSSLSVPAIAIASVASAASSASVAPPAFHAILSAAHHRHKGPSYVRVIDSVAGMSRVEFKDPDGVTVMKAIESNMLEMGRQVNTDFANGRPGRNGIAFTLSRRT